MTRDDVILFYSVSHKIIISNIISLRGDGDAASYMFTNLLSIAALYNKSTWAGSSSDVECNTTFSAKKNANPVKSIGVLVSRCSKRQGKFFSICRYEVPSIIVTWGLMRGSLMGVIATLS